MLCCVRCVLLGVLGFFCVGLCWIECVGLCRVGVYHFVLYASCWLDCVWESLVRSTGVHELELRVDTLIDERLYRGELEWG